MMYSLDSSGLAHMSAPCQIEPSSIHDMVSGAGRLNDSPRYSYSSPARCFTRPSRFVPVGVIGRRRSYSVRLSSLDNSTARLACSFRCNSCFRSDTALTSRQKTRTTISVQFQQPGVGWPESAGAVVELAQVIIEVDVEVVAPRCLGALSSVVDQFGPDALAS